MKSLDSGKTRLSPILDIHQRAAVIPAMVEDIFNALAAFGRMPVLVVTGDSRVASMAESRGFSYLMETACISETMVEESIPPERNAPNGTSASICPATLSRSNASS